MSDFKGVEVQVIEDPNSAKLEQSLLKVLDSYVGEKLNNINTINQACKEIRQQTQGWRVDIGEMTIYRFGDMLWRNAKDWNSIQRKGLEQWLAEVIESYEGKGLEQFKSIGKAHEEISKRSQIWEGEIDDLTVFRYAIKLKDKAVQWCEVDDSKKTGFSSNQNNEAFEKGTNSTRAQPEISNQSPEPIETPLAHEIIDLINKAERKTRGYVYFKEWNLNGHRWYKIGITNNPKRRDAEQNVLPVPPKTLALLKVNSMEVAKVIEKSLHKLLDNQRVKDAQNREIFELKEGQAESIQAALKSFED